MRDDVLKGNSKPLQQKKRAKPKSPMLGTASCNPSIQATLTLVGHNQTPLIVVVHPTHVTCAGGQV